MAITNEYLKNLLETVKKRNAGEPEFIQTVEEVFASIEPIISLKKSAEMIDRTIKFCDLYKIGLMSGKREYSRNDVFRWVSSLFYMIAEYHFANNTKRPRIYFKDSVLEYIGETRNDCPLTSMPNSITVNADYDLFHTEG